MLSVERHKRVVIVDTSNEIAGDGDVPHPAIGLARRMQVPDVAEQHRVMIEAVENHMPEVIIVDEIGTEEEALACRTIAERGVMLIGTAHGQLLENLIKNPTLTDLIGGVASVTLSDDEARLRGTQKSILERKGPPTFPLVLEMRERDYWVTHWVEDSVDSLLHGKCPVVQIRRRDEDGGVSVTEARYDAAEEALCYADVATFGEYDDYYGTGISASGNRDVLQELSVLSLNGGGSVPGGRGGSSPKVFVAAATKGGKGKLKRGRPSRAENKKR